LGGEENLLCVDSTHKVFVLMQFDPGMEYRPDWGDGKAGDRILRAGHAQGGGKKADNS